MPAIERKLNDVFNQYDPNFLEHVDAIKNVSYK